ncbi:MAG: hypothetical protein H6Q65_1073 [Firmicutes bacterium]|nr:hypothetical protein [Bacillota bacterium]
MKLLIQKAAHAFIEANSPDKTITVIDGMHPGGN